VFARPTGTRRSLIDTEMQITLLNSMAGTDFRVQLDRYVELGLTQVDLKEEIWGNAVENLDAETAEKAAALLTERNLDVHCVSSSLGWTDITVGEDSWRTIQNGVLDRILRGARSLHPKYVRLLALRINAEESAPYRSAADVLTAHPWIPHAYADLVRRITDAGYLACVENEAEQCALRGPADVAAFFDALRPLIGGANCDFIWDVQNMWQMGTPPTLEVYRRLAGGLRLMHLKGGRSGSDGMLREASSLRDAAWPVRAILEAAQRDGSLQMICLNPSHGRRLPTYDVWATLCEDVAYVREILGQS
jgi:sugar phosphate isomerase/epimerase